MDVDTTFLIGVIEGEIYIGKPQGFEVHGRKSPVCRLKKKLYRLKQAPQAWYSIIDGYLFGLDFIKSKENSKLNCVFVDGDPIILVLHVDDHFIT